MRILVQSVAVLVLSGSILAVACSSEDPGDGGGSSGTPTTLPQPHEDDGDDGSESDHVKVPVPAKGYIEGDFNYKTDDCTAGEDCHMLILSPGTKELFETYHTHPAGGGLTGALSL